MPKLRLIYRTTTKVLVHHQTSGGMCHITELNEDGTHGHSYPIHKYLLEVPSHLKPNPRRIRFIDPLDLMKNDAQPVATSQYKPSHHYTRRT